MGKVGPAEAGTVAAAAAEAIEAEKIKEGEGLTSLNKMLQWATANISKDGQERPTVNTETFKENISDREWMQALFPDMFQPVKAIVELLKEEKTDKTKIVEALEALEEYMQDLNYASNVDQIGALDPVMNAARDSDPDVQVAALWVLGTCLQDLDNVKKIFMEKNGCNILVSALASPNEKVRAKAVMATSALLRNSSGEIQKKFKDLGGFEALLARINDDSGRVRKRALFFLENCSANGNEWFAEMVLKDTSTFDSILNRLENANPQDSSVVEPLAGALTGLADARITRVTRSRAPRIIAKLAKLVNDPETHKVIAALDTRLSASRF